MVESPRPSARAGPVGQADDRQRKTDQHRKIVFATPWVPASTHGWIAHANAISGAQRQRTPAPETAGSVSYVGARAHGSLMTKRRSGPGWPLRPGYRSPVQGEGLGVGPRRCAGHRPDPGARHASRRRRTPGETARPTLPRRRGRRGGVRKSLRAKHSRRGRARGRWRWTAWAPWKAPGARQTARVGDGRRRLADGHRAISMPSGCRRASPPRRGPAIDDRGGCRALAGGRRPGQPARGGLAARRPGRSPWRGSRWRTAAEISAGSGRPRASERGVDNAAAGAVAQRCGDPGVFKAPCGRRGEGCVSPSLTMSRGNTVRRLRVVQADSAAGSGGLTVKC